MIERQIDVATKDGPCATFVVHPDRGGPHPVILFLMADVDYPVAALCLAFSLGLLRQAMGEAKVWERL